MNQHAMNALLQEALALQALPPAGFCDGVAEVEVQGLSIGINDDAENDRLVLYCGLGPIPSSAMTDFYEYALQANLLGSQTGGGHIGLHPGTRALFFSLPLSKGKLDAVQLGNALMRFTEKAVDIMKELQHRDLSSGTPLDSPFLANALWV